MLYNVDDEKEKNEFNENNFIQTEKKLNIRKVVLFISSVTICFFILMGSFLLTYNGMNKNKGQETVGAEETSNKGENASTTDENSQVQESNQSEQIASAEENNNLVQNNSSSSESTNSSQPTENTDKKAVKYEGNHVQIPVHSEENISKGFLPVANENGNEEVRQIYFSDEKQVYLTFDDGPSKEITPKILDILKEEEVTATFFVLGSRVESNPDMLVREYNEGHYIANHGYSHKYSQIYSSVDTVYEEYSKTEQAIQTALGIPEYHSYLFRFPGGSSGGPYDSLKSKAKADMISRGIACTNWNALTGDAEGNTDKESLLNRMVSSIGDSQSIILLMHDSADKTYTAEALPEVIKYFKDRGYTFKNFYEIFK
jgi:peptidoglycan/xylan/chitin deacetylase (PgdA/CDA1 family)